VTYQYGALSAALSGAGGESGHEADGATGLLAALRQAVAVAQFDRNAMLIEANGIFLDAFGYRAEDVVGRNHAHFCHADDPGPAFAQIWHQLLGGQPVRGGFARIGRDGRVIWLFGSYELVRDPLGEPVAAIFVGRDVTEGKDNQVDLQGQVGVIRRTMMVAEFDLDGHLLFANENFLNAYGYRLDEIRGCHHSIFISPAYAATGEYGEFWSSLQHGLSHVARGRRFGKAGCEVWIEAAYGLVTDAFGMPSKIVAYAFDVTLQKRMERMKSADVAHAADHDSLTGLYNRSALARRLQEQSLRADRAPDAVMMIDLDGFKAINDAYGHQAGDALLWVVGQRIAECLRDQDFVARLGGDEFAVLMPFHAHRAGTLETVVQRILDGVSQPISFQNEELSVSASIGVAINDGVVLDLSTGGDDLLGHADAALAEAKLAGKNTYRMFDWELQRKLQRRQLIKRELDVAIRNRDICLHYQPVVSLTDGSVVGYEALSRWTHPTIGPIHPGEFIGIAEMTGQIHALGEAVLHQAMHFAARLDPTLWVAINISPLQLQREALAATIIELAAQYGVNPAQIEIEVTETSALSDAPATIANLRALKEAGFGLSLDDFGTGYSSLSHLLLLSFNRIKIDRSFVDQFLDSPERASIIDAVLGLGRALGIALIAEGVETEEVANRLREKGCDLAQGYYFGRPIAPEVILG